MATLQSAIRDRLAADTTVLTVAPPTGLGFLVFDRWLLPTGPGSTPTAFDAAQGGRLKRSIVVLDGGEVAAPARQSADFRRWNAFPTTHIFAEAHAAGKQAAWDAVLRIEALLKDWDATVAGQRATLVLDSVVALEDSESWPGNIVLVVRWQASAVRALVPA